MEALRALLRLHAATASTLTVVARWTHDRVTRAAWTHVASRTGLRIAVARAFFAEVTTWTEATVFDVISDVCSADEHLLERNCLSRARYIVNVGASDARDRVVIDTARTEVASWTLILVTLLHDVPYTFLVAVIAGLTRQAFIIRRCI